MCEFNPKNKGRRIDPCMKPLLKWLNRAGYETVSSCCGHSRYPMSVIVKHDVTDLTMHVELFSGIILDREKRFYKTDKDGMYYIPETAYPELCGELTRV